MKKIILSSILALSLFAIVGIAFAAGAQKVDIYHVTGGSSDNVVLSQPYNGHITVVSPKGTNNLVLNGVINGLAPNTTYYVWVRDLTGYTGDYLYRYLPLGYYKLTAFVTDEYGHGDYHYHIAGSDLPAGTYNLQVAINNESSGPENIGYTVAATEKYLVFTAR